MQNTSVLNIEVKSPSIASNAADTSVTVSADEQIKPSSFEQALSKQLQKNAGEKVTNSDVKKSPSNQKTADENVESVSKSDEAEKIDIKDGKQLPRIVDDSSAEVTVNPDPLTKNTQLIVDEPVLSETNSETKLVTSSESAVRGEQVTSSDEKTDSKLAPLENNGPSEVLPKNTEQLIFPSTNVNASIDDSEAELTTANKSMNLNEQKPILSTKSDSVQDAEQKGNVTNNATPLNLQTVSEANTESAHKELLIKQINIAKQSKTTVANTDMPVNRMQVVDVDKRAPTKGPLTSLVITEETVANPLSTDEKAIKAGTQFTGQKLLNPQSATMPQQQAVVASELVENVKDEVIQLDKKLIDFIEPQKVQASVDKNTSSPLVASSIASTTSLVQPAVPTSVQPVLDVQPALRTEAWEKVMAGRVIWMAKEGIQRAELKLNPANLGPVEVRLTVSNEQTSVTFMAQNAATRDALEQSLPRLRESFQANGLSLANADVSDQPTNHGRDDHQGGGNATLFSQDVEENELVGDTLIEIEEQSSGLSVYV